jgi:hypothetical protein
MFIEGSKRTVVGLALAVKFFITGHGYAKFSRTLRQCLGIAYISKNAYYEVIKLVYPHKTDILNEMCDDEKNRMKKLPSLWCLSDAFLKNARLNHFCCLQQCQNAAEDARRMEALGKHHCRDVHGIQFVLVMVADRMRKLYVREHRIRPK